MATTPPVPPSPSASPSPQQQSAAQGTTSPKTRRLVLIFLVGIIGILVYSILHPGPQKTPRHKRADENGTPTEEQINAAMLANKAEIESAKLRQERDKKRQGANEKTAELNRELNRMPAARGGGSLSSERKRSAPSIVFDLVDDQRDKTVIEQEEVGRPPRVERVAYTKPGLNPDEQRVIDVVRQWGVQSGSSPGQSYQPNITPTHSVNDARYGQDADAQSETKEQREHETLLHEHLLPPDPDWPKTVLPEGTVIETVLKNELDGAHDGPIEVMVTTDIYLRGTHKLIFPQGTTISGEVKGVKMLDQERLAVFFHRVLVQLPDSRLYEVSLEAPGLDQTGGIDLTGKVDHHYLQIFGASLAVGAVGGLVNIGNTYGGYSGYSTEETVRNGIGSEMGMSARQIMARFLNRLPTIDIPVGTRVKIMLTGDIPVPFYPDKIDSE
jgi:type IV secretory pathway VirB10-like protein